MNNIKRVVLFSVLLLCSCASKQINNDWNKDQNGCLQLRNKDLANKLIKENALMNGSESNFLKVFGKPDSINQTSDAKILVYYMLSMCENSKPVEDSDKCWAEFHFESGELKSSNFPCM